MADAGVVAAIICAGIFGTIILWLAIYYLHRFISDQCDQFDRFFDWLANRHRCKCRYDDDAGAEKGTATRNPQTVLPDSSPAPRAREKEKEKVCPSRMPKKGREKERTTRERTATEESTDLGELLVEASPPPAVRRPRAYPRIAEQEYNPQMAYPYANPMPHQFGAPHNHFGAPQQQFGAPQNQFGGQQHQFCAPQPQVGSPQHQFGGPMAPALPTQNHPPFMNTMNMQTAPPPAYYPEYQQQRDEEHDQRPSSEIEQATEVTEASTSRAAPSRIDFVCFVDELPPMFLSAQDQDRDQDQDQDVEGEGDPSSRSRVPSHDQKQEDQAAEDIQQIPRAYIPAPVPRAYQMMQQPYQQQQPYHQQPYQQRHPQSWDMGGSSQQKQGYRDSTRYAPYAKLKSFRRKQGLRGAPAEGRFIDSNVEPTRHPDELGGTQWSVMEKRGRSRRPTEQDNKVADQHEIGNTDVRPETMRGIRLGKQGVERTEREDIAQEEDGRLDTVPSPLPSPETRHLTAIELNLYPKPILLPPPPAMKTFEATQDTEVTKSIPCPKISTPPSALVRVSSLHKINVVKSASQHESSGSSSRDQKASSQGGTKSRTAHSPLEDGEENIPSSLSWETQEQ